MSKNTTTSTLPKDVEDRYEIVGELEGGPVFDLPHFGFIGLDFSKITLAQAAILVRKRFPHLRERKLVTKSETTPPPPPKP